MRRLLFGFPILVAMFAVVEWCEWRRASVGNPRGAAVAQRSGEVAQRSEEVVEQKSRPDSADQFSPLLADEAVRWELKLSEQQTARIDDLLDIYRAELRQLQDTDRSSRLPAESTQQFWEETQTLLESDQLARLKQINWQLMGVNVFFDDEIKTATKITDEQFVEIESIRENLRIQRSTPARNRKMRTNTKSAIEDILWLLGDEQRAAFERLVGPKFTFVYPTDSQTRKTTSTAQ